MFQVRRQLKAKIHALQYGKQALVAVAVVAVAGAAYVILSAAASNAPILEAESATPSGGAKIVEDSAASGGKALKFGVVDSAGTGTDPGTDQDAGAGAGGVGDGTVGADGTLSGRGYYCVQPNAGQGGEGVRLLTQTCDKSQPQIVNFVKANGKDGGMVQFKTSQLCMLEVGTDDLSQVQLAKCDNTKDSMRWISNDDNTLKNAESGKCLRPKGGAVGAALYLEVTNCSNPTTSPNQLWCLPNTCNGGAADEIRYEDYNFVDWNSYCVQPNAGVGGIDVRLVTHACDGSAPQKMAYIYDMSNGWGKGSAMIRFQSSFLCMGIAGTDDLAEVRLAKCDSTDKSMRWDPTADARPAFQNVKAGKCLRPKDGITRSVQYMEITTCINTATAPDQAWGMGR